MIPTFVRGVSAVPGAAFLLAAACLAAPAPASGQPEKVGKWGPKMKWPNVAIHTHVLPNGKVLFWSRREWNKDMPVGGKGALDPHDCVPRLWDPQTGKFTNLPRPGYNLFCAGHTFLADGRLLVVGGHIADSEGERHASVFDYKTNTWKRIDDMNRGRWYPTAVTLANGDVVVSSGSDEHQQVNDVQQVGKNGHWRCIVNFIGLPLYPRMHLAPDGRVFMSGARADTYFLDTKNGGQWTPKANRQGGFREYAPSVLYDTGKIIFIGGGDPPQKSSEVIDLTQSNPAWKPAKDMAFARRQHNATLLPDGTILVTGGTRGGGFNNLGPGMPVHEAELWDPAADQWTTLAKEDVDRCYHATAVLLPDATVLSAGGGEYRPTPHVPNPLQDSHRDAQIFSPPYLFRGERPVITAVKKAVAYGETFQVDVKAPSQVGKVTWVRLSSVTHSFNAGQRINFLQTAPKGKGVAVTAPANANLCPPGHYMLFVLSKANVPSVAKMIQIQ
jgi:hypothetical protein